MNPRNKHRFIPRDKGPAPLMRSRADSSMKACQAPCVFSATHQLFMPHDDDVLRGFIPGILEGNRAHHIEIEAVSFKKIEPLQINMNDDSSFQDQQLLRVSPSAPWAVWN